MMIVFLFVFICICIFLNVATSTSITVIGGGVGGLVSSARIANTLKGQQQADVILLEKNAFVGGRMNSEYYTVNSKSFRFDVGPSLLLLPDIYKETLSSLNDGRIQNSIEFLPVHPFYRIFFEKDNTHIDISNDMINMKQQIETIEEGAWDSFQDYMRIASIFLQFGLNVIIKEDFKSLFRDGLPFLVACFRCFPLRDHYSVLRDFFKSPKLSAMLSFQDLYVGLSPYETPAVFSLLQALEFEKGIFYPKGGFGAVTRALQTAAEEAGVTILTNHTVTAINVVSSDSKTVESITVSPCSDGLKSGSYDMPVDVVVVNVDVPQAEVSFSSPSGSTSTALQRDERAAGMRPSCGVLSLNFAFDMRLSPLQHHTLFLSSSYEASWACVEGSNDAPFNPDAFNFYVHAPARTDPSCCPEGCDAVTVLVPVPPLRKNSGASEWGREEVGQVRAAVLRRLQSVAGMPSDLEGHILGELSRSPTDWQAAFGMFRGSAFGLAHNLPQLSALRPRIRHPHSRNLYRVGASTRPGNGVPLVMIGAKLTADVVVKDIQKTRALNS